jgi:hypothetical protein
MATADDIEAEIEDLQNTIVLLGEAVTAAKTALDAAKKAFDEEAKKPENGKAEGQPMRDSLESIMKENGLNFGDYNGRDMQGNACRDFLEKRVSIFAGMEALVFNLPEEQQSETDTSVTARVFHLHSRLMGHLDALISFLSTKRFHLDQNGPETQKAEKHRDRISNLWRYLRLSATPKAHLVEGHAIGLCEKHGGFGGLGEDEGERAHQTGAKDEKRYGGMSDYGKKARSMNQYEKMEKNSGVAAKKQELKELTKRKFKDPPKSAEDRRAESKKEREEAREALLNDGFAMLEGHHETLRDRKKARLKAAMLQL